MNIHFLGGSDEVGASCLLLELGGQRILVDAGIRVSPKARDGLTGELLPDLTPINNDQPLDAVIITHAHADHIGAIPLVIGSLPDVPVYTTPMTASLMSVMFRDALRIMDSRLDTDGELPVYDRLQVERVEAAYRPIDFRQEFSINGAVNVTFYCAGHIPGAASVFFQSDQGSVLISGDVSFSPMRATPRAEFPPVQPDALVLETTYGGRLHANRRAEEQRLIDAVQRILQQEGRVLIPAFALGRAQEVALILDWAISQKKLSPVPIYMDGMTRTVTQVFERFPDYLSPSLQRHLEKKFNLFRTSAVKFIKNRQEREAIARQPTPSIIISSSGMLTGGASPHYAQYIVGEPRSAIFITGYQDEESPGRALQTLAAKAHGQLKLYDKTYEVVCEVDTYSLSGHADENELIQLASQLSPRHIYLVHGDETARARIQALLRQRQLNVRLPRLGERITVDGSQPLAKRKTVTMLPDVNTLPITSIEDLAEGLPLYRANGELYLHNVQKTIMQLFAPESDFRGVSFKEDERLIKLKFDFPDVAYERYVEPIERVRQMIHWEVVLNDSVNMEALNTVAQAMVQDMVGRLSIHLAQKAVEIQVKATPSDWSDIQVAYQATTGFQLLLKGSQSAVTEIGETSVIVPDEATDPLEINAAYAILRSELTDWGLYKVGLKDSEIALSFITPDVGYLLKDRLQDLAGSIGYPLRIHPYPNQHQIIEMVNSLFEDHQIMLIKNPSLQLSNKTVVIDPVDPIPEAVMTDIQNAFYRATAWCLKIK